MVQPALGYHITNSQSRYITPTHLKSAYSSGSACTRTPHHQQPIPLHNTNTPQVSTITHQVVASSWRGWLTLKRWTRTTWSLITVAHTFVQTQILQDVRKFQNRKNFRNESRSEKWGLLLFFPHGVAPQSGSGFSNSGSFHITHNDTPQSVGLLWTSDQPVPETSTWQQTTITTERYTWPRRDSNPQSQQASGRRSTP